MIGIFREYPNIPDVQGYTHSLERLALPTRPLPKTREARGQTNDDDKAYPGRLKQAET